MNGFFGNISSNLINWTSARFRDSKTEQKYQDHLIAVELPKDRLINFLGVFVYLVFGYLDTAVFDENLIKVLTLRWVICAPIALGLICLTFYNPYKKYFQYFTIGVLATGSFSMVIMIGLMDSDNNAPYIIGILAIFIFFACMQRMHFFTALIVITFTATAHALTITTIAPRNESEIVSGLFFMVFIASVAIITTYVQEIRSRIAYYQQDQRAHDAALIEELLIEATAADRAKISFLGTLSHEMRTPLHQIVGFSEVVLQQINGDSKEDIDQHLTQIRVSAVGLLTMINKLLRYADATAGKVDYDITECASTELIETIAEQNSRMAAANNVMLIASDVEPAKVKTDHAHTAYAIGHLVQNAIAASKKDNTVEIKGVCKDEDTYSIFVIDNGCGMDEKDLQAALTPFTQTESYKTRVREGVGVGLTLAKKLLSDQDASLNIKSSLGEGTTVQVDLPRHAAKRNIKNIS